jgi:hypothetical protein
MKLRSKRKRDRAPAHRSQDETRLASAQVWDREKVNGFSNLESNLGDF